MSGTVDDLASLPELEEKTLLLEIESRYKKDKIYTYIGDIVIAVNPYKTIDTYGPENWKQYSEVKLRSKLPPHLYVISDCAYQSMKRNGINQCCVVSGESGAGKTESTKLMIEHIVQQLCQHDSSDLHRRIIQVNPLLEAFGNAQTVINDNSSRFGKYVELNFDSSGQILGASLSEYLLEKSRVVTHSEGERSFHIFYYFFAGLDKESKDANLLKNPEDHRILKQFHHEKVYEDDSEKESCRKKWNELLDIMKTVGFTETEIGGILAILAAILHIADIKFLTDPGSEGVRMQNENVLSIIGALLSVKPGELVKALISNTSSAGNEKVLRLKNESQANDGRDALARALYGRLFNWIVNSINRKLQPKTKSHHPGLTIGILDIYGFENFKNNSFEQLCINVANEQLQYFFNLHIFKLELEEYNREGIQGSNITFVDNRPLLDLFMDRLGLFALLDEESMFPQGTDQSLIDKLAKNLDKKPEFKMPKGQGLQFMIQHFAGQVTYNVSGFLEKNRDTLSESIMRCLLSSESLLVYESFGFSASRCKPTQISFLLRGGRERLPSVKASEEIINQSNSFPRTLSKGEELPKITKTLASHFKNSLDNLLQKLMASEPHFVRCIKPNAEKEPNSFKRPLVLQQLSCTGVLETVKIRKQGYSSRLLFTDFIQRYGVLSLVISPEKNNDGAKLCQRVLQKSGINDWQIGKTKVFLKYWHVEKLNLMVTETNLKIIYCQKFWRSALSQLQLKRLKGLAKECLEQCQMLSRNLARISGDVLSAQQELHSHDVQATQQYAEQMKLLSSSVTESGRKCLEMLQHLHIDDTTRHPMSQGSSSDGAKLKNSRQPTITDSTNQGTQVYRSNERPKIPTPANFSPPRLPDVDEVEDEDPTVYPIPDGPGISDATMKLILDEIRNKLSQLSTDIWAKVYYMEKNSIVAKVYLREWETVMNSSATSYNGVTIGINSPAFQHIEDAECLNISRLVGNGVKISRDNLSNMYLSKFSRSDVILKGYHDPTRYCFSRDVEATHGRLTNEMIKVFDVSAFKQKIAAAIADRDELDLFRLAKYCFIGFSFKRDTAIDLETPCWVIIVNLAAMDLLGKTDVLEELERSGKIHRDTFRRTLMKEWLSLDFKRSESGAGQNTIRASTISGKNKGKR